MIAVVVSLGLATICFSGQCHPALIGQQTPTGVFPLMHARVLDPAYGGDVLAYARRSDGRPLAIHRVWLEQPKQRRLDRLRSTAIADRQGITAGCINVMPEIYQQLVDCCANGEVEIRR
jgi:hypothetical protein